MKNITIKMNQSGEESSLMLACWGIANEDCIGFDYKRNRYEPTFLDNVQNPGWTQIECGTWDAAALSKDGEMYTWGPDSELEHTSGGEPLSIPCKFKLQNGEKITRIFCGRDHKAAISNMGNLFTWGLGDCGQLGHGNKYEELQPKRVKKFCKENVINVAFGWYHTVVITSTGSIYTFGLNSEGELGVGGCWFRTEPSLLADLSAKKVIFICANATFTVCVTAAGETYSWGTGSEGQLGHGDYSNCYSPKRIEALVGEEVKQTACGESHTAVCTKDGKVFTFGNGSNGELGHGRKQKHQLLPKQVLALTGICIHQVQCGQYHTMALASSGYLYSWGKGTQGQLGHGDNVCGPLPIPCLVEALRKYHVVQISSYDFHCGALVDPRPSPIRSYQESILHSKEDTGDVEFIVEDQRIFAHVEIISNRSEYFQAMFRSGMRESLERVVVVPNCSKSTFQFLLEYLYTDALSSRMSAEDTIKLYCLAHFYQLYSLVLLCVGVWRRFAAANDGKFVKLWDEMRQSEMCALYQDVID